MESVHAVGYLQTHIEKATCLSEWTSVHYEEGEATFLYLGIFFSWRIIREYVRNGCLCGSLYFFHVLSCVDFGGSRYILLITG